MFDSCLMRPISRAQCERSLSNSTSFLSISSMRRRQSEMFMRWPRGSIEEGSLDCATRRAELQRARENRVAPLGMTVLRSGSLLARSWRNLAAGEAAARGFLERTDTFAQGCGCRVGRSYLLNFRNQRGADHRGVREPAQHRNVSRQRNPEARGNGELREAAHSPKESGQVVGQRVLRTRHAGARNQIEKTGRARGDFHQSLIRGSGRGQENGVQMMRLQDLAILR